MHAGKILIFSILLVSLIFVFTSSGNLPRSYSELTIFLITSLLFSLSAAIPAILSFTTPSKKRYLYILLAIPLYLIVLLVGGGTGLLSFDGLGALIYIYPLFPAYLVFVILLFVASQFLVNYPKIFYAIIGILLVANLIWCYIVLHDINNYLDDFDSQVPVIGSLSEQQTHCEKINTMFWKTMCLDFTYLYQAYKNETIDLSLCMQSGRYKNGCVTDYALETKNSNVCLDLDSNEKTLCLRFNAIFFGDANLCELMDSDTEKNYCRSYVQDRPNDLGTCVPLTESERFNCLRNLAVQKSETFYCYYITDPYTKYACLADLNVEYYDGSLASCYDLTDIELQQKCLQDHRNELY